MLLLYLAHISFISCRRASRILESFLHLSRDKEPVAEEDNTEAEEDKTEDEEDEEEEVEEEEEEEETLLVV